MAIRFTDVSAIRGKLAASLDGVSSNFVGTSVAPVSRTGVLHLQLSGLSANLTGLFTPSPSRTGSIASTLGGISGTLSGTFKSNVTVPAFAPVQPAAAFVGIAGVRTYTDATQQAAMGRFNLFVMGVSWEGWAASGRDLEVIVKAIKAASTAPNVTVLLNYLSLNSIEEDSGDGLPTYTAEIAARNWRLYNVGSSGTLTTPNTGSGTATALVNYTTFVPQNPSGEYPYDFGAKYSYNLLLTKTRTDARFTGFAAGMGSPSLDGVYQDNFLCDPRVNGDFNRDGTTDIGNTLPCAATPWLQAGQLRYVQTMRSLAPGKYVFVNGGDYGLVDPGVMSKQVDGLLAESYMGKSFSYDSFKPFTTMLGYYYAALAAAANPRMVVFGGSWPDTNPNGTALVRLPTSGGFPPLNTQWQWARYIAATAYLGEGMPGINRFSQGYSSDLAALDWYDFFGGVNSLARGWIGAPKDALRPTTPKIAKGPVGIFGVEYANAMVLVNPVGNGSQTVVAADIPGNWKFLTGTQDTTRDSGAAFSSVTMPERDGLFLQRAAAVPSVPSGLTAAAVSSTQINLSWTASTDVGGPGLAGYRIYRAGTFVQLVTGATSFSDSGLAASTAYSYQVSAIDNAGIESAKSTAASATTLATAIFAPNMPAGMTKIWDRQFNKTDSVLGTLPPATFSNGQRDQYGMAWLNGDSTTAKPLIDTTTNLSAVIGRTIPALPDGNPTCLAVRYPSGYPGAQCPFFLSPQAISGFNKIYACFLVCMPDNFNNAGNNIKWLDIDAGASNDIFMLLSGNGTGRSDYRGVWMTLQDVVDDNLGGSGGTNHPGSTHLPVPPAQASGPGCWLDMFNTWVVCEYFADITNQRFWSRVTLPPYTSSFLVNDFNINFGISANSWNNATFCPYYGGGGSSAPGDQYILVGRSAVYGSN